MSAVVVLALVLAAPATRAHELEEERSKVQRQLQAQAAVQSLLKSEKVGLLEVLDLYQGLAQQAEAKSRWTARELRLLRKQVGLATLEESAVRGAYARQLEALSPRLRGLYRLSQGSPLEVLLPAPDLAALVWRSRAYSTLLRQDLDLLQKTHEMAAFQREARAQLDDMQSLLAGREVALKAQAQEAQSQRADLRDALALIQAQASQSSRVTMELKASEEKLTRTLDELASAPLEASAFGGLKGKLSLPADGTIEVAYGNVVNPKFNTVTVQKGLDVRAPLGSAVRAVAPGRVVYAAFMHGYGNILIIDHGSGYHTLMGHLATFEHRVGDGVEAGAVVGTVGDSGSIKGAYLYFELRHRGLTVDPALWLAQGGRGR
jgi:septal ring factor EnvC (AmiA/AmiB activator)